MDGDSNKFVKGMNQDAHPGSQLPHTYREMRNFVPLSVDGDIYSVTNEDGTELFSNVTFPPGFQVIGYSVLNNDIIVVLAHPSGYSQVGYIRESTVDLDPDYGYYRPVAPKDVDTASVDPRVVYPETNSEFGFTIDHPVDCVSRKLIDGHRILYYTDNNIPFGRIDLDTPPEVGAASEQAQLVFSQQVPVIDLVEIQENIAGSMLPGVYQFVTRYVTANGGVTTFGIPCDPISMVPPSKSDGVDKYHGGRSDSEAINKSILLQISNVDLNFQELELIVSRYTETGVFVAETTARIPITSDSLQYSYGGPSGEEVAITREEIRQVPISYKRAKCIDQKDNTLFFSNLSDDAINNETLQEVANHISVDYKISELPYSGRQGDAEEYASEKFEPINIQVSGSNKVVVTFRGDVYFKDFLLAVENGNHEIEDYDYGALSHTLEKNGNPSTALIDVTNCAIGDTLEVDTGGTPTLYTCVASGAVLDETLEFEFNGSYEIIAQNLTTAISNVEIPTRNHGATLQGTDVLLIWEDGSGNGNVNTASAGITAANFANGVVGGVTTYVASDMELTSSDTITYTFDIPVNYQISMLDSITSFDIRSADSYFAPGLLGPDDNIITNTFSEEISLTDNTVEGPQKDAVTKGFTDYVDEKVIFDKRTYRRGEVYSLGFMLLMKDGSTSFVYHIPGQDKITSTVGKVYPDIGGATHNTGETTGVLGTYVSEREYPLDQFYPGNEDGDEQIPGMTSRNIRHHVMPNLSQEPHFERVGGESILRPINLEFTLDPSYLIPPEIAEKVQEIVFVRERRNIAQNKSVLSSGIINKLVETANLFEDFGVGGSVINGIKSGYCLEEVPFFNNLGTMDVVNNLEISSGLVYYPGVTGGDGGATNIRGDRAVYYSPESILAADTGVTGDDISNAIMKPWLELTGIAATTTESTPVYIGLAGVDFTSKWGAHDMHGDYYDYAPGYVYSEDKDRIITGASDVLSGQGRHPSVGEDSGFSSNLSTEFSQGGWEVKVRKDGVPDYVTPEPSDPNYESHAFIDGNSTPLKISHEVQGWGRAQTCTGITKGCRNQNSAGGVRRIDTGARITPGETIDLGNHLYNIETTNTSQYEELGNSSYIPIKRFPIDHVGSFTEVFGGDTFITKFAVNTGAVVRHQPAYRKNDGSTITPLHTTGPRTYRGRNGQKANGYELRACHYYFVESDINTNYRHRPEDQTGGQNYYPNEGVTKTNLDGFYAWQGNIQSYNGLYSYENNLREYYVKGSTQQVVTDFENRIIYSEQAFSDTVVDAYRSFLVNNYHDIPSNTGPIWDTFVHANTLYAHTPKSCWRTFAEPAATLSGGNISDVVLGTGPLFARPSTEVLTSEGGYGGSISQYGGVNTTMGYIYPDILQGKVFAIALGEGGPFLKDLSLGGMYTFFHSTMGEGLISNNGVPDMANITTVNAHLIDNPYNGIGFSGGYDHLLKRAWLTKQGEYTISYSVLLQGWSSFHDYTPNVNIPFDNRTFFLRNLDDDGDPITAEMWEMNKGPKGTYFGGTPYPSTLEHIVVATGMGSAMYGTQVHNVEITDQVTGVKVRDDFWNTFNGWTDRQNTGTVSLIEGNTWDASAANGETLYKFRNDEYRLAIPRDSVYDNGGDVFALDNIYEPEGGTRVIDDAYGFRERIKGEYSHFAYSYDNSDNHRFVLREIKTIFDTNYR